MIAQAVSVSWSPASTLSSVRLRFWWLDFFLLWLVLGLRLVHNRHWFRRRERQLVAPSSQNHFILCNLLLQRYPVSIQLLSLQLLHLLLKIIYFIIFCPN